MENSPVTNGGVSGQPALSHWARLPLLPALIGLARAADASAQEPDKAVFSLLRQGLDQLDSPDPSNLLARIQAERNRLIPGCAACASPCGRTVVPTPEAIAAGGPVVLDRKGRILALAKASASNAPDLTLLRAMFALGEQWTPEQLDTLIQELQ